MIGEPCRPDTVGDVGAHHIGDTPGDVGPGGDGGTTVRRLGPSGEGLINVKITLARRTLRRAGAAWKVEWLSEEQKGVLKSPRFEELSWSGLSEKRPDRRMTVDNPRSSDLAARGGRVEGRVVERGAGGGAQVPPV